MQMNPHAIRTCVDAGSNVRSTRDASIANFMHDSDHAVPDGRDHARREQGVTAVSTATIPVFDGHNDTILAILGGKTEFFSENESGHIDLPRAKRGGLAGGFFAVFVPDPKVE